MLPKSCSRCGSLPSSKSRKLFTALRTRALTSGSSALIPAVSITCPPWKLVRNASLRSRILLLLCCRIAASLNETGEHQRRDDAVLAAVLAPAAVLVGLHFGGV